MTEQTNIGSPPEKEAGAKGKGKGKNKKENGESKTESKGEGKRSALAAQYPADAPLTVLAEKNPKREGSKAHSRFELYKGCKTVGDYLNKTGTHNGEEIKGTLTDLAYNVGRGFVKVG